jgi:hypothetical protein
VIREDHRYRDWAVRRDWDHRVHRLSVRRDVSRGILRRHHRDATSGHRDATAGHRDVRSSDVGHRDRKGDQWHLRASGVERPVGVGLVDRSNSVVDQGVAEWDGPFD